MTRSELIERMAMAHPHLYHDDIEQIVATVFEQIGQSLAQGDRVELRGFGVFSVRTREPRRARNPKTGEQVSVAKKNVPFFKAGKKLKQRINNDK